MRMRLRAGTVLLVLALLQAGSANAQSAVADSIINRYSSWSDDSNKVKALAKASLQLASSYPQASVLVAKDAIGLAGRIGYSYGMALGYIGMGHAYERYSNNDSAFRSFFTGLQLFRQIGALDGQAQTTFFLGEFHEVVGNFDSAAFYAYMSLDLSRDIGETNLIGRNYRIIGNILTNQNRLEDALRHYFLSLDYLTRRDELIPIIARVHENIALVYIKQDRLEKSEHYFREANRMYQSSSDARGLARVNLNMASLFTAQGKYQQAIDATNYALEFYKSVDHSNGIAESYNQLSNTYFSMGRIEECIAFAESTLAILDKHFDRDLELSAFRLLEKSYHALGRFEEAYHYLARATALGDSLYNAGKNAIISELEARYEFRDKDDQIQLLNSERELDQARIKRQEMVRNAALTGIAMVILIGVLLLLYYRAAHQQKQQAERVRISSDLHDEVGSTLSSIGILSAFVSRNIEEEKIREARVALAEISNSTRQMADDINDIVWALNPDKDDFNSTINRLHNFASIVAEGKNISLDFSIDPALKKASLPMTRRKNLFLIGKEAINNAVKYSGCQNLWVGLSTKGNQLQFSVRDDGAGFDMNKPGEGNGLKTMHYRAAQIKAGLTVRSAPGKGTQVLLAMKI